MREVNLDGYKYLGVLQLDSIMNREMKEIRYGAGVLDWTKEELKSIDIKTRKLVTMNENLHPRANVGRLYLA